MNGLIFNISFSRKWYFSSEQRLVIITSRYCWPPCSPNSDCTPEIFPFSLSLIGSPDNDLQLQTVSFRKSFLRVSSSPSSKIHIFIHSDCSGVGFLQLSRSEEFRDNCSRCSYQMCTAWKISSGSRAHRWHARARWRVYWLARKRCLVSTQPVFSVISSLYFHLLSVMFGSQH